MLEWDERTETRGVGEVAEPVMPFMATRVTQFWNAMSTSWKAAGIKAWFKTVSFCSSSGSLFECSSFAGRLSLLMIVALFCS